MKSLVQFINESVFSIRKSQIKNIGDTKDIIKDICKKVLEENDYLDASGECVYKLAEFIREICKLNNIELPEAIDDNLDSMSFLSDESYEIFDNLINLDYEKVYNPTKQDVINLFVSMMNNVQYR